MSDEPNEPTLDKAKFPAQRQAGIRERRVAALYKTAQQCVDLGFVELRQRGDRTFGFGLLPLHSAHDCLTCAAFSACSSISFKTLSVDSWTSIAFAPRVRT